jgi:hypothetical protein
MLASNVGLWATIVLCVAMIMPPNFLLNSSGQSLKLLAYGRLTCTQQTRGSNALRGEGCLAGARRSDPVAFMVTGSESCPAINGGTMRARIVALSLALALVVVGIVSAEESGNWFTRLFTSPSPDKKVDVDSAKVKDGKGESTPMPPSARAIRIKQATADKERRDAVCIKLRDLAIAHGDDEMFRKVEQLERRVGDVYFATIEIQNPVLAESNGKKGGR